MTFRVKDLPFTDFFKRIEKTTKKITSVVFPNDVEIGTTESPANLSIASGSISIFSSAISGNSILYLGSSADNDAAGLVYSNADDELTIRANSQDKILLTDNGVAIDDTSPTNPDDASSVARQLVVGNTASSNGITIFSSDTGVGTLAFGDSANNNIGRVSYDQNNTEMDFAVGDLTRVTFTNTSIDYTGELNGAIKESHFFHSNVSSNGIFYFSWYGSGSTSSSTADIVRVYMPTSGRIYGGQVSDTASGVTWTISILRNNSFQDSDSALPASSSGLTFNVTFSQGDYIAVRFQATSGGTPSGDLWFTLLYELDHA